jgi:hypothetical protein
MSSTTLPCPPAPMMTTACIADLLPGGARTAPSSDRPRSPAAVNAGPAALSRQGRGHAAPRFPLDRVTTAVSIAVQQSGVTGQLNGLFL